MDKKEEKKVEKNELDRLINKGIKFKVTRKKKIRRPGMFGFFRHRIITDEVLEFEIHEPTLFVLDMISAEGIMMEIDDSKLVKDTGINAAKSLAKDQALRMAKVVAIAVLGEEYEIAETRNGRTTYTRDDKRLNKLTQIFAHSIKPSKLLQLCIAINTMSNLGDFTNCIRLTSASRTTIPNRIQE